MIAAYLETRMKKDMADMPEGNQELYERLGRIVDYRGIPKRERAGTKRIIVE